MSLGTWVVDLELCLAPLEYYNASALRQESREFVDESQQIAGVVALCTAIGARARRPPNHPTDLQHSNPRPRSLAAWLEAPKLQHPNARYRSMLHAQYEHIPAT